MNPGSAYYDGPPCPHCGRDFTNASGAPWSVFQAYGHIDACAKRTPAEHAAAHALRDAARHPANGA